MLNRAWHETHRMPERATRAQRISWHVAHARACGCRAVPESIRAEVMAKLGTAKTPRKPALKR